MANSVDPDETVRYATVLVCRDERVKYVLLLFSAENGK